MDALLTHGPTVLLFVAVLALLVLFHELGHFLAARFFGIEVDEFAIGFPPRAFSVKKGKTVYSLNWIPLGGYVKIAGEDDPSRTGPGTFASKSALVRTVVICAGVFMNLVLSSLLFGIGFTIGLPQVAEGLSDDARLRDPRVQVIEVLPSSAAAEAGIRPGDTVLRIDGRTFADIAELQAYVNEHETVRAAFQRGKETLESELTPRLDAESGKRVMGVALVETATVSYPWYAAFPKGIYATGFYVKEIVLSVADAIKGLFVGKDSGVEFSGPVGIAVLTGRAARLGFAYLLQFAALLSVNLAVVNILPIPALDGGRLLFVIIEKFRGKAVRPMVEAIIHRVAFFLLLGLIVFVTIKDLGRYGQQILNAIKGIFGVT